MIQQLIDGLFDGMGLDRTPIKRECVKKRQYPEYRQLSIFEVLKEWAEKRLSHLYALYSASVKDLKQLQNPDSFISKILKSKRDIQFRLLSSKVDFLINEIAEFSHMWGLI
jgi:hypothetical protein